MLFFSLDIYILSDALTIQRRFLYHILARNFYFLSYNLHLNLFFLDFPQQRPNYALLDLICIHRLFSYVKFLDMYAPGT